MQGVAKTESVDAALKTAADELGRTMRVLLVEDDVFQQMALKAVVEMLGSKNQLVISLTTVDSGSAALDAITQANPKMKGDTAFDLVLLDYQLPGGNGDLVLPQIRAAIGQLPAIIMLSGSAQQAEMQRCWLDLGADSYRLKPVSADAIQELLRYALRKRNFLQKRNRPEDDQSDDGADEDEHVAKKRSSGSSSVASSSAQAPAAQPPAAAAEAAPAIVELLAIGRRGPVHIGFAGGPDAVAIKVYPQQHARGAPPPPHPFVNRVLRQLEQGDQLVEVRELCDGGEFYDNLIDGCLPVREALAWFEQMAGAVAHCHACGAVHGRLHPENVLILRRGDADALQLTGFTSCAGAVGDSMHNQHNPLQAVQPVKALLLPQSSEKIMAADGGGSTCSTMSSDSRSSSHGSIGGGMHAAIAAMMAETKIKLSVHEHDTLLDAPELAGRECASAKELVASDVWSMAMLLVYMLTGRPDTVLQPDDEATVLGGSLVPQRAPATDKLHASLGSMSLDVSDPALEAALLGSEEEELVAASRSSVYASPPPPSSHETPTSTGELVAGARSGFALPRKLFDLIEHMRQSDATLRPTSTDVLESVHAMLTPMQ